MISDAVRRDFGRSSNETLLYIYARAYDPEIKNYIADVLTKRALKDDDILSDSKEKNAIKQKASKKHQKRQKKEEHSIDFFDPWDPER